MKKLRCGLVSSSSSVCVCISSVIQMCMKDEDEDVFFLHIMSMSWQAMKQRGLPCAHARARARAILYVALCFPLKTLEIYEASLPTASFGALIIYQSFFVSFFLIKGVIIIMGDKYKE